MKQIITPDQESQWTDFLLSGLVVKLRNFVGGVLFLAKSLSVTLNALNVKEKRMKQVVSWESGERNKLSNWGLSSCSLPKNSRFSVDKRLVGFLVASLQSWSGNIQHLWLRLGPFEEKRLLLPGAWLSEHLWFSPGDLTWLSRWD